MGKKLRHPPKPFHQSNPLGFTPDNFSPAELKRKMQERKVDTEQDLPRGRWWDDAQQPQTPLLSLATDILTDLKQETNKGDEQNLHIVHEFELEEIERAKEYEQRAQLWDQQRALEQEMEMSLALAEAED